MAGRVVSRYRPPPSAKAPPPVVAPEADPEQQLPATDGAEAEADMAAAPEAGVDAPAEGEGGDAEPPTTTTDGTDAPPAPPEGDAIVPDPAAAVADDTTAVSDPSTVDPNMVTTEGDPNQQLATDQGDHPEAQPPVDDGGGDAMPEAPPPPPPPPPPLPAARRPPQPPLAATKSNLTTAPKKGAVASVPAPASAASSASAAAAARGLPTTVRKNGGGGGAVSTAARRGVKASPAAATTAAAAAETADDTDITNAGAPAVTDEKWTLVQDPQFSKSLDWACDQAQNNPAILHKPEWVNAPMLSEIKADNVILYPRSFFTPDNQMGYIQVAYYAKEMPAEQTPLPPIPRTDWVNPRPNAKNKNPCFEEIKWDPVTAVEGFTAPLVFRVRAYLDRKPGVNDNGQHIVSLRLIDPADAHVAFLMDMRYTELWTNQRIYYDGLRKEEALMDLMKKPMGSAKKQAAAEPQVIELPKWSQLVRLGYPKKENGEYPSGFVPTGTGKTNMYHFYYNHPEVPRYADVIETKVQCDVDKFPKIVCATAEGEILHLYRDFEEGYQVEATVEISAFYSKAMSCHGYRKFVRKLERIDTVSRPRMSGGGNRKANFWAVPPSAAPTDDADDASAGASGGGGAGAAPSRGGKRGRGFEVLPTAADGGAENPEGAVPEAADAVTAPVAKRAKVSTTPVTAASRPVAPPPVAKPRTAPPVASVARAPPPMRPVAPVHAKPAPPAAAAASAAAGKPVTVPAATTAVRRPAAPPPPGGASAPPPRVPARPVAAAAATTAPVKPAAAAAVAAKPKPTSAATAAKSAPVSSPPPPRAAGATPKPASTPAAPRPPARRP